ncbi:nucleocapsid protein, partial [Rice Phasma-like virus 1]
MADYKIKENLLRLLQEQAINVNGIPDSKVSCKLVLNQFISKFISNNIEIKDVLKSSFQLFEYQSFDPEWLYMELVKGKDEAAINAIHSDLAFISMYVALCGTNFTKRQEKSTENLKSQITLLVSKYNIIANSKTGKYKKSDRTMGRMAAILPWYGVQYAALRSVDDIAINHKDLRYIHPGIKTPQFGSLIPKNHFSTSMLKEKYLAYMSIFDKTVNPKSNTQDSTLLQYLNAMMNSK